uniref:Reverse transcriptase domain-containing protein n=1 Tax=Gasterosteus aculeatus aculeatus TaxID=481459 RepID=A0AAQ4NZK3_GASAC
HISLLFQSNSARAASLSSVLILLDLSAAFDTVNHQILISSRQELGVSGSALSLLSSYLDGRTYRVTWRGSVSEPCPLTTGVPQGSVLGPLLFSLYTNSLGAVIRSHGFSYHSYADDTQLILSFPPSDTQVAAQISACLTDISQWMSAHHLKINPDKTELLLFPGKDSTTQDLTVNFGNSMLTPTLTDSQLSLTPNITATTRSCRYSLQHQENTSSSHSEGCPGTDSGSCHLPPGLL